MHVVDACMNPFMSLRSYDIDAAFADLILPREIKEKIQDLAHSICRAHSQSMSFSPILFCGPDGKRMAAMTLAKALRMDYAQVCGQDVITTGVEGVSQIQTLFSWANLSSRGVLLFIDKVEVFLSTDTTTSGENALSAFLSNMCRRRNVLLVLATNQ
jgi:hypothetical protein